MDDSLLDRKLQEAAPYISDDGFTARILANLPPAGRQRLSLRAPILLGLTLLGTLLTYVLSDGGEFVVASLFRLSTISPLWLLTLCGATGLAVAAGGGVAAVVKMRQPQL